MTFDWMFSGEKNNRMKRLIPSMHGDVTARRVPILVFLILFLNSLFWFFFHLLFILFISYVKWRKKTKEMSIKLPVYSDDGGDSSYIFRPKNKIRINTHRSPYDYNEVF